MQSLYYLIQLCIHRKYIVHHLITAASLMWCSFHAAGFYLAFGTALFQGVIVLLLLAREYRSRLFFALGMGAWLCIRIIAHLVCIGRGWVTWTPLEKGFNLYIWGYSVTTFIHLLNTVARAELKAAQCKFSNEIIE